MSSSHRESRPGSGDNNAAPRPSSQPVDILAEFSAELERLSASQRALMEELRSDGSIDLEAEELARLRAENAALLARVEELERLAHVASGGEDAWPERQAEYEKLLHEKSETIRALNLKLQELKAAQTGEVPVEVRDAVVDRMKRELEEQRCQLEEDEQNLMQQIRNMEMALAKDRAELARRMAELQRQQADFAREVEMAGRDPELRERLAALSRRAQDNTKSSEPKADAAPAAGAKKDSGFFRRLFS
jgi:hypothetical protein